MKKILNVVMIIAGFVLFTAPAVSAIASRAEVSPGLVLAIGVVALTVLSLTTKSRAGVSNGVEVEVWANYIIERLWKDNTFLKFAFSDDDKVIGGKIVHIPQPGAMPEVQKNRTLYPAAAVRRTDTDVLYALDEYTVDPTHIPEADKVELSYDKIDSVYGDHAGVIAETMANDMIIKWLTGLGAGSIIRTSGVTIAATLDGTTGNRKSFTEADLRRCALALSKQKIAKTDRYALLTVDMEDQLKASLTVSQYRDYSSNYDAVNGIVGRLHGFNIMTRASVAVSSAALAISALDAVVGATDHDVSLVWQKNAVARAIGEHKFFENVDRAEYYGDVYSCLLRAGGRRRRADNNGVISIIQDTAA